MCGGGLHGAICEGGVKKHVIHIKEKYSFLSFYILFVFFCVFLTYTVFNSLTHSIKKSIIFFSHFTSSCVGMGLCVGMGYMGLYVRKVLRSMLFILNPNPTNLNR